jgi:hypothetical protein
MVLAELLKNPSSIVVTPTAHDSGMVAAAPQYGIWMGIFGAVLGTTLFACRGMGARHLGSALRSAAVGAGAGAGAGFMTGYLNERLFAAVVDGITSVHSAADWKFRLAGAVAHAIFGLVLGLAWGATDGWRPAVVAGLGGAFGGAFGGFVATEIELTSWIDSPFWSRLVSLILIGVLVVIGMRFLDPGRSADEQRADLALDEGGQTAT